MTLATILTPRQRRTLLALLERRCTREDVDRIAGASNGPDVVRQLRQRHGLNILCSRRASHDRGGRKIEIGIYHLAPTDSAAARRLIGEGDTSRLPITAEPGYLAALAVIGTPLDALAGNASMLDSASDKVNRLHGQVARMLADPMNSLPVPDVALLEALPHLARDLLGSERFMRGLKLQAAEATLSHARGRLEEAQALAAGQWGQA